MKKGLFNVKAEGLGERTVRFKISSEVIDRDGDILIAKGCDFENFAKNPLFLGFHDRDDYPLGIPKNWGVEGNAVYCDVYFPTIKELSTNPDEACEKAKLVAPSYIQGRKFEHIYHCSLCNGIPYGGVGEDSRFCMVCGAEIEEIINGN
jgi:hypothetical protein